MTDIVERLKRIADADYKEPDPRTGNYYEKEGETIMEAVAEIERLREALEWFADETNYIDGNVEVDGISIARTALKGEGE